MRAIRIDRPGHLAAVEVPDLQPGPGEVVVDVAFAGICGSDLDLFEGRRPGDLVSYPVIPGHEWSGTAAVIGPGVDPDLQGRKVVGEGFGACGDCAWCRSGEPALCEGGYDEIGFTRPGAWADQLLIPARYLHVLAEDADLRGAAGLEPAACAADAVARAGVRPGDRVAVIGCGMIGALAIQLSRRTGPAEIVVVEPNPRAAQRGISCGATSAVHPDDCRSNHGTFDAVIEAAGVSASPQMAVDLVRKGGRVVLAGLPATALVDAARLVTKRALLLTVFGATRAAWKDAVEAFTGGWLDPSVLVTHEFGLSEAGRALDLVADRSEQVNKVLLNPQESR